MTETETVIVARGMAEFEGENWNAASFCETLNGEEPAEMRERFIEGARFFITTLDRHRIERGGELVLRLLAYYANGALPGDFTNFETAAAHWHDEAKAGRFLAHEAATAIAAQRAEIEQGRRAGIEEAARYVQANYPFDKRALVPAIRALLTSERDTKADSDGDDGA